jgi:MFS family permease
MLAFLFFALTPNLPAPRRYSVNLAELRILWHDRTLRFHLIGFGLLSMTGYTMLTFASSFIRDYAGGKSMLAVFSLILLGTALSVVVAGKASDYLARGRTSVTVLSRDAEKLRFLVPLVTSVVGTAIYSVSFVVGNTQVVFAFFGAGMIITSSYNGLAPALLQNLLPEILRPVGGAVYLFVVNLLGLAVGPPLAGWIADASGSLPLALFLTMITGNLGAAACFAWILRKNKT